MADRVVTYTLTRRITDASVEASRENGKKGGHAGGMSEEHKAKLREAQRLRREREKQERAALGLDAAETEKKPIGRPRKSPVSDTHTPKRGRGRPKKSETAIESQNAIDAPETAGTGQE